MTFTLLDLTSAALAGAGVGFLSGVFGLGGGFLIVPVLKIVLTDLPMEIAVGAGACQVLGPATTSLLARRVERRHFRFPLIILGGLIVGGLGGVSVLRWARNFGTDGNIELFGRMVTFIDFLVLFVYFTLLSFVGVFVIWESRGQQDSFPSVSQGLLSGCRIPPLIEMEEFPNRRVSIP